MLRVKFWRIENVVLMKVLEQDEDTRGKLDFTASNGFRIRSRATPALVGLTEIRVRGFARDADDRICIADYSGVESAKNFISRAKEAVAEYNATQKGAVIPTTDDVEITIAE